MNIVWGEHTETWVTATITGHSGTVYQVAADPLDLGLFDCECDGFRYDPTEPCKHLLFLYEQLWDD